MREKIKITLSKEMLIKLDRLARNENISRNEIIRRALEKYLSVYEFRDLRKLMLHHKKGLKNISENQIFRLIS